MSTSTNPPPAPSRRFAPSVGSVWDTVTWEKRDALIQTVTGEVMFSLTDIEAPSGWSDTAVNVVASRYFSGDANTPNRERSIKAMISRVCDNIAAWGLEDGYFDSHEHAMVFRDDLRWLCLHQHLAFNSPVWFNVGARENPQASACFLNAVEDTMESILQLTTTEGLLFKQGSGSGANLSAIRGRGEPLTGGGTASGPVDFMRGHDAMAGAIKSGGRTRRSARMVMLDDTHPDVFRFINCKADEEKKAHALIDAGYDGGFNVSGGAYDSIDFQNANHSVRLSDRFMDAAINGDDWDLLAVTTGEPWTRVPAADLLDAVAEASWLCGDPGVQFYDEVNRWHTCSETAPIRTSNPCGEFVFLDNTACNLSSFNLMKFLSDDGTFQAERFGSAVSVALTAMDILVSRASYPTPQIADNSERFRPLGLGYSNLGAVLMATGRPYDSDAGRLMAAEITALMTGYAYTTSAALARRKGAFDGWEKNREPMARVVKMHARAAMELQGEMAQQIQTAWESAQIAESGYRNSQVSLLAPCGTISFMMDCDTTGVEPELALVKTRTLSTGGSIRIVNQSVPRALGWLGYSPAETADIVAWVAEHGTAEGAPNLRDQDLPVFDCSLGKRSISPAGHLAIMAAVQPFLSGAISKTINMPAESTPAEIKALIIDGWRMGVKSVTIYRDGSKRTQPISAHSSRSQTAEDAPVMVATTPNRRRLPSTRQALTHKFSIDQNEGYLTVGLYEDGTPGELFVVMSKEGSVISGLVNAFSTSVSMALQYGVPLEVLCKKFAHTRFEPSGFTGNPEVPFASSICDYVFRWLQGRFLGADEPVVDLNTDGWEVDTSRPPCPACGALMVTSGTCFKCANCGGTSGCS